MVVRYMTELVCEFVIMLVMMKDSGARARD